VALLTHPAITEHVTGRLISAIDLDRWLRGRAVDWSSVIAILERIGLRTAAWTMVEWTRTLLGTAVPAEVMAALTPGLARQRYLRRWLAAHPAQIYERHPWLVRGGFSLALQQDPHDVVQALWRLLRKKRLSLGQDET
jgi:hypothetical protein